MSSLGAQSRLERPSVRTEENGGRWCVSCDRDERREEHCCATLTPGPNVLVHSKGSLCEVF